MGVNAHEVGGSTESITFAPGVLFGYALRSGGATPATTKITITDGQDGDTVIVLNLAAGESVRDWFGPQGISIKNGIRFEVETGIPEGAVFYE